MPTTQWTAGHKLIPALSVAVLLGAALYSLLAPEPARPELDALVGQEIQVEGTVVRDPEKRENTTHITVEVENVAGTSIYRCACRVLVFADRFTEISYGDRVSVIGTLRKPEAFETDTGRTFNYPKYLLAHGITHTVMPKEISILAHGEGSPLIAGLVSVKHALIRGIESALPEPESALLAGLLLGEKQSLGENLTDSFRKAGVVHIIVLSGYNVAVVSNAVLFAAAFFLPRAWALTVAGVFILAFAVMTGASETTIRASAMALIVLFARFLHRPTESIRILLLVAAGMALLNPYLVLFDLSYQLSILATLGLVLFSDKIAKRLPFIPETLGLREIVATTIGTQLTVLPLLILSVGSVSAVFLFANVLVLPAVPLAMFFGFVAALLALFSWVLAFPFSLAAYGILSYVIAVSVFFGELPFSAFQIPNEWALPAFLWLMILYALGFFFFAKRKTLE